MSHLHDAARAFVEGRLSLRQWFEVLDARGTQPDADHQGDLAALEALERDRRLPPDVARSLRRKLLMLQEAAASGEADDATRLAPRPSAPAPDASATSDVTVFSPIEIPPPSDLTVMQPVTGDLGTRGATAMRGPATGPNTGSSTGSSTGGTASSGSSSATWRRLAAAEVGETVGIGSVLKGRFTLERELGRGGMGVVYQARDERKVEARDRDPYIAVKVLNDEFRRHPDSLISLQREARRSQQLAHDNIVRVFDFDKDGAIVFMTMEYIDGADLKTLIREQGGIGLPLAKAMPLIDGMARGLARAHEAGIVHSDFKPGNVLVTRSGVPKVFDFGIARAGQGLGDATGEQTVFDAGTLGALTPAYASLEMILGREPEPSDDMYALGCVIFELLTGSHPYGKASAEIARKDGRVPPPVPGLSRRQYRALCAAVAFTREQRLASADALLEGLRERSLRERALPALLLGVPALMLIGAGGLALLNYRDHQRLERVIARFDVGQPGHFADEDEARAALDSLDSDQRNALLVSRSDVLERFLLARIGAAWEPDQGRYDYAGALKALALRDRLKFYSPPLDQKRQELDRSRNALLNTLDSQLSAQIDADALFDDRPDNASATLARIQAIDPGSSLLRNPQLELKYDMAIGRSIAGGRLDEAQQRLTVAQRWFPESARLGDRQAQVTELAATVAAAQQQEAAARAALQERAAAIERLTGLIDRAVDDAGWRQQAAAAYREAAARVGDNALLDAQAARLKSVLAAQSAAAREPQTAIDIAGFAVDLFPADAALAKARKSLIDQQNRLAQLAQTEAERIARARMRVAALLAQPGATVIWLQDLASALDTLRQAHGGDAAGFASTRAEAGRALTQRIRDELARGQLDEAERIARAARQIEAATGGADFGIAVLQSEIASARVAAQARVAQQQAQAAAEARRTLAERIATPTLSAEWQAAVSQALAALKDDAGSEAQRSRVALTEAIAAEAVRLGAAQQLPQARAALDFGLKQFPKSPRLLAERTKIDQLQQLTQARLDQDSADAEVRARIESARSAAAANDIQKTRESLARIRSLKPDEPFPRTEGLQLLSDAFQRLAAEAFQRRNEQVAADLMAQAQKVVGDRAELRPLKARYELVVAIRKAGPGPLAAAEHERLKRQLDDTRRLDTAAFDQMERDLFAAGQLPEKTFAARLDKLKPVAGAAPAPAASPAVPPAGSVDARPSAEPANPPAAAAVATTPEPEAPFVATGPDPCNKPELIGHGKTCVDLLAGGRRPPRLIVVPGAEGGNAYALSRSEVSIANYNEFCAATRSCATRPATDEDFANAPITGISATQATAYVAWLGKASGGYRYRLPTEAEWTHAARAGGGFRQSETSNCLLPGAAPGSGFAVSAKGRDPNPWGLVHMSGNVWEWATAGGGLVVRGGSFNEYWSACTVDARRDDNGRGEKDVGFRVLRELK